jgi:hypothetical protein
MRAAIPQYPLYRDTVQVKANGYLVIRFVADNPGINLFHCHIEWHVEAGLTATLIEAPMLLQQQSIPADHLKVSADLHSIRSGGSFMLTVCRSVGIRIYQHRGTRPGIRRIILT